LETIPVDGYPILAGYSREDVHRDLAGQGGLFLAGDMALQLDLKPGMRVLDLSCGWGETSIFLARHFKAEVYAADQDTRMPDKLAQKIAERGVESPILPFLVDARQLPFQPASFDAVFCMNSFFYFGAEPDYPRYLATFLKPGGRISIGSPCYKSELTPNAPPEFLLEYPACLSVHSPAWWEKHFEQSGCYDEIVSIEHRDGVRFWPDRVHRLVEEHRIENMPAGIRQMVASMLKMIAKNGEGYVTHFILSARRNSISTEV
jgi:SAM-dependent methyltransferase